MESGNGKSFDTGDQAAEAIDRFEEAIRTNPYQGAIAALYAEGKALEFMADLLAAKGSGAEPTSTEQPADHRCALAARDILRANLADPPTIADLARRVGLSQRRLNEAFRAVFGAGPYRCLTDWRLSQARHLLENTDLSVKEIAHTMGYTHLSSFSHAYRRRFGTRPSHRAAATNRPEHG